MPRIKRHHVGTTEALVAESSVPVDLLNPGQVFACLGLVEAAELLIGDVEGVFDWTEPSAVRFWLRARGNTSPVAKVLAFLAEAEVYGEAPACSPNHEVWKSTWGRIRSRPREDGYSIPDPPSPATVVGVLQSGFETITIDHWGDSGTQRDDAKFWAGMSGKPGVALVREALDAVRAQLPTAVADPFSLSAAQDSTFRLDWRHDYIPIDAGFSLNAHGSRFVGVGFPLVEVLGAIGLTHARPVRCTKYEYEYGVIGCDRDVEKAWFQPSFLRAALGNALLPFSSRRFRMMLGRTGDKDVARTITTVTEERIA